LCIRKITKIIPTRCYILRLKCTKFDFSWGSAPDPANGRGKGKGTGEKGERGKRREGRGIFCTPLAEA